MGDRIVVYSFVVLTLIGCAPLRSITKPKSEAGTTTSIALLPSYSGPKAYITIADFDVKAAAVSNEIGKVLRHMLTTLLINSNRFSIVEHKEQASDLIITASLIEFEPQASGGRGGVGGGGGVNSGILGGLLGASLSKARIALEIRIVDASTSKLLSTTRVLGQASDAPGNINDNLFRAEDLGPGLSIYVGTPMEKAIRICIIETVRYIYQNIPEHYYNIKNGKT